MAVIPTPNRVIPAMWRTLAGPSRAEGPSRPSRPSAHPEKISQNAQLRLPKAKTDSDSEVFSTVNLDNT